MLKHTLKHKAIALNLFNYFHVLRIKPAPFHPVTQEIQALICVLLLRISQKASLEL